MISSTVQSKTSERTLRAIAELFAKTGPRDFAVRLWDGSELPAEKDERFVLVLSSPASLRSMLGTPLELRLGESFVRGEWDIEGDIIHAFRVADRLKESGISAGSLARLLPAVAAREQHGAGHRAALRGREHSASRDAAAIRHHYDVGNDFFALWLDRDLVYSCGYFGEDCRDLDRAQRRKLDHICRKLRLEPGQRMLDIGCGWGALVRHAAREYGVEAVGITLSPAQAAEAERRIASEGLADLARVHILDYRDAGRLGEFDAVASVGMFEHVGRDKLGEYFSAAFDVMRPGGVFLNHGISRELNAPPWKRDSFIQRYVFPDGELVPISQALLSAERAGFEVRDVESLREHYAQTLAHWVHRLEEHAEEATSSAGDATYRIWRLYMAGSANAFSRGYISVFQSLLLKPTGWHSGLPPTREDWYSPSQA